MRTKLILKILTFGFISTICFCAHAYADIEIGKPAPQIVAKKLDGSTFDLLSLHRKVVIVHFWATWCSACKEEMKVLEAVHQQYHPQGLEIIGLSTDRPRNRDKVTEAMRGFSFPAALLADVETNGFGNPESLPVSYIIDKSGILHAKLEPKEAPLTQEDLTTVLKPLLSDNQKFSGAM